MILVKMMLVNLKEAAIEVCNVDDTAAHYAQLQIHFSSEVNQNGWCGS